MDELTKFKELFWIGFHKPSLNSPKFLDVWSELEPINTMLAGPFFAIYSNGNCDYVFHDKIRFPKITDIDDFLDYCTFHIHNYNDEVSKEETSTDEENKDKELLLHQTDVKMELANLAYQIQKGRMAGLNG